MNKNNIVRFRKSEKEDDVFGNMLEDLTALFLTKYKDNATLYMLALNTQAINLSLSDNPELIKAIYPFLEE